MSASNRFFDYSHQVLSISGVDDRVWEQAVRRFLAAMLVAAHREGVHIVHARVQSFGNPRRLILRSEPLPKQLFACMLTAGQQAHAEFLQAQGLTQDALKLAQGCIREALEKFAARYRLDLDTARREVAPLVRDNTLLIGTVATQLAQANILTGSHIAALADPTRPDPAPGTRVMSKANRDWLAPHVDITVLAALPAPGGELAQTVEGLLPTLATHANMVTAVPVHQLHWPLCWGADLSEAATESLVDAVRSAAHMVGPVSAAGLLHLIPVHSPTEIGLYLDEYADGMDRLVDLAMGASSTVERDPRSRICLTGTAHLTVARCHTPGLTDRLMDTLGIVTTTVELRALAVLRLRYDDHAAISQWQVLDEVTL